MHFNFCSSILLIVYFLSCLNHRGLMMIVMILNMIMLLLAGFQMYKSAPFFSFSFSLLFPFTLHASVGSG